MYLKAIEIQGFKSFADKIKVTFEKGVTAIVGPNGSGKSNITESLRWALGESSAKSLRGGKMPDVIFAGTENRKPLNYASVAVTLDNSEQFLTNMPDEVIVERHIYRSGETDYLINGKKVRLRDIHDLFMDTGLGRDSFSVISQGRVEEIFKAKPEERRTIFEEAAGVLKYKTRKRETQQKLSKTQENLDRLEDIIYELENQEKPLAKQAETAKVFQQLESDRQSLQLDVLVSEITLGNERLVDEKKKLQASQEDLKRYYHERSQLEEKHQILKTKRGKAQEQLDGYQAQMLDLTQLISSLESKIRIQEVTNSQKELNARQIEERRAAISEKMASYTVQKEETLAKQTTLEERLELLENQISETQIALSAYSKDPDVAIEELRERFVFLMQEEADLSNQEVKVQQVSANLLKEAASQSEEGKKHQEVLETSYKLVEEKTRDYNQAHDKVANLLKRYTDTSSQKEELEKELAVARSVSASKQDTLKVKQARKASLEAIQKSHSNFFSGVKAVLQNNHRIGGIIGAVSEQISFESNYQVAMEVALGAASQHIIVTNEEAAKKGIAFLKQEKAGRATFLPLTTLKARSIPSQHQAVLSRATGYLGTAASLVTYHHKIETVIHHLLGSIALFDTIEHANAAATATHFQVRMVTLDGSEIRTGGSFSGGVNRHKNTTFVKPELDTLDKELKLLAIELSDSEKLLSHLESSHQGLVEELAKLQTAGEEARLDEQRCQLELSQEKERYADLERLQTTYQPDTITQQVASLQEEEMRISEQLTQISQQKASLSKEMEVLKSNRSQQHEKANKLQETVTHLQSEKAGLMSEKSYLAQDLSRIRTEEAQIQEDLETLEKQDAASDASEEVVDTVPLYDQLDAANTKQADHQQAITRVRLAIEAIEGQLEDVDKQMETSRVRNDDLIREQARLETAVDQEEKHLATLMQTLSEEYHLSFQEAKDRANALDNLEEASQALKTIEKEIRALGPINIEAITQYDEVHERLTFMTSQRSDVLAAKNLLQETINDMDGEVKERFKATFEAIRESFKMTFTQIFGGGSADLLLTDNDLLIAGIDISVQPPGKKIQSLNLMSGGEKALSALALLFAIIRVKAIPFVILDEVEAALDEANVNRFGDYLKRFDQSSQFIVVTHRKGTMAAADSIYGVTMQESGVSKVLSVKLKDIEGELA